MKNDDVIDELLALDQVILAREHPRLENALVRAASAGRLVRPLPGVFADPGNADQLLTKVAAVSRWDPNAVIRGRAAAALTYWPELEVSTVEVASPTRHTAQAGFAFQRRRIPAELVQRRGPFAFTTPPLTAIELATLDDTDPIDMALRQKVADLASLQHALEQTRKRRGNTERWRVLLDSRAEPWSKAERLAHRLYRDAGITGWVGNLKICGAAAVGELLPGHRVRAAATGVRDRRSRVPRHRRRVRDGPGTAERHRPVPAGPCCGSPGRC